MREFTRTTTFAVPLTGGQYAPEILYLTPDNSAPVLGDLGPQRVTIAVGGTILSGAEVEVDVMDDAGSWVTDVHSITATGIATVELNGLPARVRVVSGGTNGNQDVTVRVV